MPVVRVEVPPAQRVRMIRSLKQRRGMSHSRASELVNDTDNLVVTYIVRYEEVAAARRFAFIQSAYAQDADRRGAKVRQLRTRHRVVTLRNVRPGALYRLSYSVEISTRIPRRVVGTTQTSAPVTVRFEAS